jgi:hypothetical protein
MQGYDITPILHDSNKIIRECCFIENDEEVGPLMSRLRHLVTSEYKLTIYEDEPKFGDIYNRKNDPDELTNLWTDNSFKEKRFELINRLLHENLKAQTRLPKRIAGT